MLKHVLLPALKLVPSNPGLAMEIWSAVQDLPYLRRHALFVNVSERREVSSEKKQNEIAHAECCASYESKQALKRLGNEKKSARHVGRQLAKIAHSHPETLFEIALSQIESYDNMIPAFIESLSLMTPLALDVLSCLLPHRLSSTRPKLQSDGISMAHWFYHLAQFSGTLYRAYPEIELGGLIDFLCTRLVASDHDFQLLLYSSLREGNSLNLLVFNELLLHMGGCAVLDDISEQHYGAWAGA